MTDHDHICGLYVQYLCTLMNNAHVYYNNWGGKKECSYICD